MPAPLLGTAGPLEVTDDTLHAPSHDLIPALRRSLALLTCLLGLGLLLAGHAGAAADTQFGFNEWNDPSNYGLQPQLGMPVRRWLLGWNQLEPTQGSYDFGQSDVVYQDLLAHGLKPLIVIQSAPCWANASVPCSETSSGAALPPDAAHLGDWSRFIATLAARYPAAVAMEIWNEPNLTGEWLPYPDPAAYAAVLKTADQAVKSVVPSLPVISGGLFVSPTSGPYGMGDVQFLSGMYAAGVKGHFDGIGIHPYPIAGGSDGTPVRVDVDTTERTLDTLRFVRAAAGDSGTPLWITEMGVSTQSLTGSAPAASPLEQATELLTLLTRVRADADVKVALIHSLLDYPIYPGDPAGGMDGYGVFNNDGTPKLAACQLSLLFHGSLVCPGVSLLTGAIYTPPTPSQPPASQPPLVPSLPPATQRPNPRPPRPPVRGSHHAHKPAHAARRHRRRRVVTRTCRAYCRAARRRTATKSRTRPRRARAR